MHPGSNIMNVQSVTINRKDRGFIKWIVVVILCGGSTSCQASPLENSKVNLPIIDSISEDIDGRQLFEDWDISSSLCGGVPSNFPFAPIATAQKNVLAHKDNIFAESVTDMGYGIVWGLMGDDERIKEEYRSIVNKYGAVNYELSDTCAAKDRFYSIVLGAYNREVMRLLTGIAVPAS